MRTRVFAPWGALCPLGIADTLASAASSHARSLVVGLALACGLPLVGARAAHAQAGDIQVGNVTGVIRNAESGQGLDYANVVVRRLPDGAQWGTMTLGAGRFFLKGLPAGRYALKVLYLGYRPIEQEVLIEGGQTVDLRFDLEVTIVKTFDTILVEGKIIMVDVKEAVSSQSVAQEALTEFAMDTVEEAISKQVGVVARAGEIHIRGGRSNEVSYRIDGVPVDDPIGGGSVGVSSLAVANIEIVTGGQDAEYGNALSGVIDVATREGGDTFEGGINFETDDFGRQDRTYTNFDQFEFGLGGPSPLRQLTYYVSGQLRFSDEENYNRAYRPEHKVELFGMELFKFRRRQFNDVRTSAKLAYTFNDQFKLTAEHTVNYTRTEPYLPNWDVQGYRRQLVLLPEVEVVGAGSYRFTGRFQRVDYGPWVARMQQLSFPARVAGGPGGDDNIYPVLEVRNTNGQRVLAVAQPVFQGARNPLGTPERPGYSTVQADSSYVAFNSADLGPQNRNVNSQSKLVLRHTIDESTFYTLKMGRLQFLGSSSVGGFKQPYQFLHGGIESPSLFTGTTQAYQLGQDYYTDPTHPMFVTTSEFPFYEESNAQQYSLRVDLTSTRYENHRVKSGIQFMYNDLEQTQLGSPALERPDRFTGEVHLGGNRNIFHTFNPEASFYAQDRWEYEGMVISAGVRWDLFSPGSAARIAVDNEEVNHNVLRFKSQFSPRLGFAFPITDRDGFHFHYGRFIQFPERRVLFASQDAIGNGGTLGNPDLDAQLTITYQAGVRHQFSDFVAGQVAVYNRDVYGQIAATQVTDEATGNTLDRYINKAYANARGLEFTLERRLADRWSVRTAYTYAFADGVASDQEFGTNPEGLEFIPNQELPLDWDRRHSLYLALRIAEPELWSVSFNFDYGSGFPWTPVYRFERKQDPLLENSRRLPSEYELRMHAERQVNIYGQDLSIYMEGFNLINQDLVRTLTPGVFPGAIDGTPAYREYLTETGKYGGAYLQDIDGDQVDDFVPLNDPRVFAQHRTFRVGMAWRF